MPTAVHGDLLVMQFSAHFLAYHGKLIGDTLYPNQLVYPLPIYLLMALMQFLLKPLMPYYHIGDVLDSNVLFGWFNTWHRPIYLFLLKVHYLPFDYAGALLFTRWGNTEHSRLRLFRFWMLNPLLLFGTYAWGQFDIIPMFFTLLSLHYARQGKATWAGLWLGIGAAFKIYPLLFLPFLLLLATEARFWRKALVGLVGVVPYIVAVLPYFLIPGISNSEAFHQGHALLTGGENQRLTDAAWGIGYGHQLYIYFIIYGLLLFHAFWQARNGVASLADLWRYEFATLMFIFPLVNFHPFWLVWLVPAVGLYLNTERVGQFFPYGFWLLLHAGLLLCDWGNPFTVHLVAPTFVQVMRWPDVRVLISTVFPAEKLGNILRSLLLALTIGLVTLGLFQIRAGNIKEANRACHSPINGQH